MDADRGSFGTHPLEPPDGHDRDVNLAWRPPTTGNLDWRQVAGGVLMLLGFLAILFGWWGMSGTTEVVDQFSYLMSGGVAGAALIAVGATVWVSYEHTRDRAAMGDLAGRMAALEEHVRELARSAPVARRAPRARRE